MESANLKAIPKKYISGNIKLDFSNTSNLKDDIQNRISDRTETNFCNTLNNMMGDDKSGNGVTFSEITLMAMAYFFDEIFIEEKKDYHYSLHMVKGFLDAKNLSPYTAIHEIDVEYFSLKHAPYFKHCWLIIQTAWFFNSEHFGHHQHIDFLNHFATTGQKLPIASYNFDGTYLEKKYLEIQKSQEKQIKKNGYSIVRQWFHCILFLVCKELDLSTKNFKISVKDNREYNPLTKTSRQLRALTPFKLNECDIKSAFPTFIDIECKSNLKNSVYENLMSSKNISRADAKVLYNTNCNSGAYKSKEETAAFLLKCGYSIEQAASVIELTHNREKKFISFMTEYERFAIETFIKQNDLQRAARLHDSVVFIDNTINTMHLKVAPNCDFEFTELNTVVFSNNFSTSKKILPYAYVNSLPQGLNLIYQHEEQKPNVIGEANGFRIYEASFKYISGSFNLNENCIDFETFSCKCEAMFSVLLYLNDGKLPQYQIKAIFKHIRESSNIIFNVRWLSAHFASFKCDKSLIKIKTRDYKFSEIQLFRKKIEFLNALNKARGLVSSKRNFYNLFCLMQERFEDNDYDFMSELKFMGRKKNNKMHVAILQTFNKLTCGRVRKERSGLNSYPLYTTPIKRVTIKSMSLKPQQQNAHAKRMISNYEKELLQYNKFVQNRESVKQLFLIICELSNEADKFKIKRDDNLILKIKSDLMMAVEKSNEANFERDSKAFDRQYINLKNEVSVIVDLKNVFPTQNNYSNSIFNNIPIEEASSRGEQFFSEYLKFHECKEETVTAKLELPKKNKYGFYLPDFDFDSA